MKRKLLTILFVISIFLVYTSCVNEMEMIDNEQNLEIDNRIIFNPPTKELINYDKSTIDGYSLYKIETMLDNLYEYVPQAKLVIDWLAICEVKFKLNIENPISNLKSWYKPYTSPSRNRFSK